MSMSQALAAATSSTNFESIFTSAFQAYKKRTKKDITSHPLAAQLQTCHSPDAILSVLQAQVQVFDQSRSADERLTKWLNPTVHVLYAFSATLGQGIGMVFSPARIVFAGIGVLLQVVKEVRDDQDALVDLFGHIEYFFRRLETYIEVRPTAAMTEITVKIMVEVLFILGVVTKEIKQGRIKKYLKVLIGMKDIEDALRRLDKLTQEEARMAAAEVLKITQSIEDNVKNMADKVQGVDEMIQDVNDRVKRVDERVKVVGDKVDMVVEETRVVIQQVENQVNDINRDVLRFYLRRWLCPPDPSSNYNTACDTHHEGTSAWCTQSNTFAIWQSSGGLLWIHGKPGSGKTILSSAIIQDVKKLSDVGSALVAYFYFDFKDTEKQDSRALLSSLLVQLSDQSDLCCDALFALYSAHKRGSEQPTVDTLMLCLKNLLTTIGPLPTYLIVDALDECPDFPGMPSPREKVLGLVGELVEFRHPNLRLCITSRPEFDICIALRPLVARQVSLHDESGQKQDIVDYVTYVVRSDKRMKRWRDEEKDMIIDKLTEKVDGMFRWVFCQLEVLRHCFPPSVRQILEELPESLDETYERILKGINKANRRYAHRLLQCLVVASRPLQVEELADVLAVDFNASTGGAPNFNVAWCWENQEEAVLSACSSLVSVIGEGESRVVQFSHFSVREFLTSDRLANSIGNISWFHIALEPAHAVLAYACLAALFFLDGHRNRDSMKKVHLVEYAAHYWIKHAQFKNVEFRIKDAVDQFFDMDKPHFSAWVQIYDIDGSLLYPTLEQDALFYAALCGFHGLVERHIAKHPQHIRVQCGRSGAALHFSVLQGRTKAAKILVAHSTDINLHTEDGAIAVRCASEGKYSDTLKRLLDHGADVAAQALDGLTPLHCAAYCGRLEASRILLEHSAPVNARNISGHTLLHIASMKGHIDVARLLLDHGADANARNNRGNSPLYWAAAHGNLDLIQILLEQHAEVNAGNNTGSTPFHTASDAGQLGAVRLLLDYAADARVRDNTRKTPLHLAAAGGHLKVSRLLLELKAEIDARDDDGRTPLHLASRDGTSDVVRLLLDRDADAHVRDNAGNTLLHFAALNGSIEVIRMLLERKVEVNARNDEGVTALHEASAKGRLHVLRVLLEHGADAGVCDQCGKTACDVAWFGRRQQIRELLSKPVAN